MGKADAEALPFVDGTDPLYRSANNGDVTGVKRLLSNFTNKKERWTAANSRNEDAGDNSALHVAAARGYLLMAKHLLDAGAVLLPDDKGRTPLHLAAANDDALLVALLLKRCKDPLHAKTRFTTAGYSRPAAPIHLCKKPDIRKMLFYRGCMDEDGGKTRIILEGTGRGFGFFKPLLVVTGVVSLVSGLYIRARWQIAEGFLRPQVHMRRFRR
mmetsp:Transcript_26057/g.41842  ORF Transcript_26057/g.41842 Transcript_26057/m.41842 type:complete len:213 (-) Transcript_26057:63-701(-)|eukprot:CAMPEP_0181357148 /NCGR_PEP_ID=MMETSP1106-20121128/4798_1 /TAXON_ID=81844 /ORGANISM="Mantoniella antarctica, Strain SL-175" /LENGTH=212 /DNA_ID=CAMNT_0023469975 /DNA_START=109 /DNA_END=747 /DNA_ORIENTATION=+